MSAVSAYRPSTAATAATPSPGLPARRTGHTRSRSSASDAVSSPTSAGNHSGLSHTKGTPFEAER